jgi:hypothetical protein
VNNEKSLANVRDFERRIRGMGNGNEDDEIYIRKFIAGVAEDCPTHVLAEIALWILEIRKKELRIAAETS